MTFSK